jgi:hypothetical protein
MDARLFTANPGFHGAGRRPQLEVALAFATTKVDCRWLSFRNGKVFPHSFDDRR